MRKRKSPQKHTVHTKHPRYVVHRYKRGSEHMGHKISFVKLDGGLVWAEVPSITSQYLGSGKTKAEALESAKVSIADIEGAKTQAILVEQDYEATKSAILNARSEEELKNLSVDFNKRKDFNENHKMMLGHAVRARLPHVNKKYTTNKAVAQDARKLSGGTMATLTGYSKYEDLDRERENFARWIENVGEKGIKFQSWQEAWKRYHLARYSKSTIVYANEAKADVTKRFGEVSKTDYMGKNDMGNPYYRVTYLPKGKELK